MGDYTDFGVYCSDEVKANSQSNKNATERQRWMGLKGIRANPRDISQLEFEISESRERNQRSESKDLQKLGWITSVSGQTVEARHHVHSQNSVQIYECRHQATLSMQKPTFVIFQGSMGLKLTFKKEASCDLAGDSDEDWSSDVNDRNSIGG